MKSVISATTEQQRRAWSLQIEQHLTALEQWKNSRTILAFLSMDGEVETAGILKKALAEKKTVAVPRMHGEEIRFHTIESAAGPWERHRFGVREPSESSPTIDPCSEGAGQVMIVTPGLCFDADGGRLGFGKGYYDRLLERCRKSAGERVFSAAVCFSIQLVDKVPSDDRDHRVNSIVTEKGTVFSRVPTNPKCSRVNGDISRTARGKR